MSARVPLSITTRRRIVWIAVLVLPLLVNSPKLLGLLNADPVANYSALRSDVVPGPLHVYAEHDPSVGSVFQPLGYRAADEMVHGRLPWWNSLQGIGAPLAGSMSTGSLFPLIFLELLPNGQVVLDIVVQILAGLFMLLLARRIGLGLFAACVAALLFELNGTIAWLNAGWCYPLPFLPLLLYGIELAIDANVRERTRGSIVVAVAVGLSISAAMIEVAYLDGLLALCWAMLRLAQTRRSDVVDRFIRLALAGVLGILLAAPLLVAFGDFLSVSYAGLHEGASGPHGTDVRGLAQVILPYVLGQAFYNDSGYGGVFLILLAVCGMFGFFRRGLRSLLGCWVFVALSFTMGLPYLSSVLYWIPGVRYTAYWRYLDGSWEFALALLAAFFIDDLARNPGRLWIRYLTATAVVLLALWIGVSGAFFSVVSAALASPDFAISCWSSVAWCVVSLFLLWVSTLRTLGARRRVTTLAVIVVVEATVNYAVPMLGFPRHVTLVEGSVDFVRDRLGLQRVFAVNTLAANYGSYFHVAELDDAELPVAKTWADYISTRLDTLTNQGWLYGRGQGELARHIDAYEDAGMKYIMTASGKVPYENFDEPVDTSVAARPINLIDTRSPLDVRVASVPLGSLRAVSLMEGNYGGTADGRLHVHVCSGGRCVDGYRPLSESPNNAAFWITLDRSLEVTNGVMTMTIAQERATVNDAVWLYGRAETSNERVIVSGKEAKGYVAVIQLSYDSIVADSTQASVVGTSPSNGNAPEGLQVALSLPHDVSQYVTSVVISGLEPSGKAVPLLVCSLGTCSESVPPVAFVDSRERWYTLPRALRARDAVTVTLEGTPSRRRPISIRLGISTERPSLVYHDAVADVFEMPHPADYFTAPNCTLIPRARERVDADCRAASFLTRRELYLPGWSATRNGRPVDVRPLSTIYQAVDLPAGESTIVFSFEPPFMEYGYAAFVFALLVVGYQTCACMRPAR